MRYEPDDQVEVTRNQGKREAIVLAVIDNEVLIEYTMPKGTTALNITTHEAIEYDTGDYKTVSYKAISTKWLKAIVENGLEWVGYDQRNHRTIKRRHVYDIVSRGKPTPTPLQMLEQRLGIGLAKL